MKVVAGGKDYAYTHNVANRSENIITISASGNAGFVNFWNESIFASDVITVQADTELKTKYIFNYLKAHQEDIFSLSRGSSQQHVYPKDIKNPLVPNIPEFIQKQLITQIDKLDEQYQNFRMKIEEYRKKIMKIFENLDILGGDA